MSQELIALSTEKRSYLTGFIHTSKDEKSNSVPVYVVIVDDNSGSMSGLRANYCVEKTKVIIRECIAKGVEYQYAT